MTNYLVIDSPHEYHQALDILQAANGPVAIDTERASGYRYSQRAYLIQVFRRGAGTFLFDAPAIGRFDALQKIIANVTWVFHAASQDLACLREVGLDPHHIFDTELSARILGIPRVGLGTIADELLGIHMAKEHSAADWSTRPLPVAWLEYAARDVEVLLDLQDVLTTMLETDSKTHIADEEFHAILTREPKPPPAEPWRRLSGIHALSRSRERLAARELWLSREALAEKEDIAPGRLVPDSSLIAAAIANPPSKGALARLKTFTGRASRSRLDVWWDAIERARHDPTELPPVAGGNGEKIPHPKQWAAKNPDGYARFTQARNQVAKLSEENRIPVENLLTPSILRRVAWAPPEPLNEETIALTLTEQGARTWQVQLLAPVIVTAFVSGQQSPDVS